MPLTTARNPRPLLRPACLVAALLALGFAPIPKPKSRPQADRDLNSMQGMWVATWVVQGGGTLDHADYRLLVEGKRAHFRFIGGVLSYRVTLLPGNRMKVQGGEEAFAERITAYRIDGDTLILANCVKALTSGGINGGEYCAVYRREKKKKP